jgi:hypothetical protein
MRAQVTTEFHDNVIWARWTRRSPRRVITYYPDDIRAALMERLYQRFEAPRRRAVTRHQFENQHRGVFIIQDIHNPLLSWAMRGGHSIRFSEMTNEAIDRGLVEIFQSPTPNDENDLSNFKFGIVFERIRGAGDPKIPGWINMRFRETWKPQVLFF